MPSDKQILVACRRGDRGAFCELYETYVDQLLTVAVHLLHDVPLAEDVVQDVFVTFVRAVPTLRLTGSLRGYLATCTANRARDALRRRARRRETNLADAGTVGGADCDPLETAARTEELEAVQKALAELPYDQRETVVLRHQGQMKFREIAAVQNVTLKTVQSRYRYGMDRLRALLGSEGLHETR
jgi:RNA polymerase sigma factor (sigma-70 family)